MAEQEEYYRFEGSMNSTGTPGLGGGGRHHKRPSPSPPAAAAASSSGGDHRKFVLFLLFLGVFASCVIIEIVLVETVLVPSSSDRSRHPGDMAPDGAAGGPGELLRPRRQQQRRPAPGGYGDEVGRGGGGGGGTDEPRNGKLPPPPPPPSRIRPLDRILEGAGVDVTPQIRGKLATPGEVEGLYGPDPIVLGLEKCGEFRDAVRDEDRFIGPAGMFNTGTNLMSELLQANCANRARMKIHGKNSRGIRLQVPWGKHSPVLWRGRHTAEVGGKSIPHSSFLPIVVVKDPYNWMSSMCRHPYSADWLHDDPRHCPNLYPVLPKEVLAFPFNQSIPVTVRYGKNRTRHDSLAHLWNDWYGDWRRERDSFPFLIVRFEDLLFHAEEVITEVCHCAGGEMDGENGSGDGKGGFKYIEDSAKKGGPHEGSSGLASAMMRYANATLRLEPFWDVDVRYARRHLDRDLMEAFGYRVA